jgi:D-xylose transport system substrate-binding protein
MNLVGKPRLWGMLIGLTLFSLLLAACGSAAGTGTTTNSAPPAAASANGKNCKKVGVLLPETASSARWDSQDRPDLEAAVKQAIPGATVDYNNAQGDADTQATQADADLTNGDCILIIAPSDSQKAAAIVAKAKAKSVPVIAYDRLIYSNDLNYYVSFDNTAVGGLQGQYVADHYQDYVKANGNNNIVMINGSKTDNNALLFYKGATSKLQTLFDSKALNKVYDQYTPNWDNPTAQTEMEGALTSVQNKIAVAYVANDGMAGTVIAALKAHKLNGKVLVTGQDATAAGIHNILAGDQSMTVYKAINKEADAAAQLAAALSNGTATTSLTNGAVTTIPLTGGASIPSVLEIPVAVDKTNIATTVLADNFVTKADICTGLPAGTGGIC